MSDEIEPTVERWYYMGRRLGSKNATRHAWLDPADEQRWFDRFPGAVLGGAHDIKVSRDGDRVTVHGQPTYVPNEDRHEQRAEWAAADATAMSLKQRDSLARKHGAEDTEFTEAIAVLRRIMDSLPGYSARVAFRMLIHERLG